MNGDELDFPPAKLRKLNETMQSPNGVVAVFPKEDLESILDASINMCKKGTDVQSKTCQKLFREDLTIIFTKILTDSAISSWSPRTQGYIYESCEKLLNLCIHKLDDDSSLPLLELLAMVFDPNNKFHTFNAEAASDSVPPDSNVSDEDIYARPLAAPENPQGWLVDLINEFGDLGGFVILESRFQSCRRHLTIPMIRALLQPFSLCYKLITTDTIDSFLVPIVEKVLEMFEDLTDEELKKEAQNHSINHDTSVIFKAMKNFVSRLPNMKRILDKLELLRLKMLRRLLKTVKNTQELLGKFVFNLSSEDLDDFLQCIQTTWVSGENKKRVKLLELIRRLSEVEDNTENALMHKILTVFWNIAHSEDVSTETMEQALDTHLEILTYMSLQDRNHEKTIWLDKCVEELKSNNNWTLQALRKIRKICDSYESKKVVADETTYYRDDVISLLDSRKIMLVLTTNLKNYMDRVRTRVAETPEVDGTVFMPDAHYNHVLQVQKRLDFLTYVMDEGTWWLTIGYAKSIWQCLTEQAIFESDREACFKWFFEMMRGGPLFLPEQKKVFFEENVIQLDPKLLTPTGMDCFERFFELFKNISDKSDERIESIGREYVWRVVARSPENVFPRALLILEKMYDNLKSQLNLLPWEIQRHFISECMERLQTYWDKQSSVSTKANVEGGTKGIETPPDTLEINRIMKIMHEYMKTHGWRKVKN